MPELPEVETVVRGLRAPLIGRTVLAMSYDWPRTIHSPAPGPFAERIAGQTFRSVDRRAKYIIAALDHDYLIVHLKMTGRLYVAAMDAHHEADQWVHFRLRLDADQELRFSDSRKFGKVYLTDDPAQIVGALGPEPLSEAFTEAEFATRIAKRTGAIKPLLLDQQFIAGLGNIYVDESLFRAGIHPLRRSDSLTEAEIMRLYAMIRAVLSDGIAHEGASINWYRKPDGTRGSAHEHFRVYDRDGQPCVQCGTPIGKTRVAQRGTHFCPVCQPIDRQAE